MMVDMKVMINQKDMKVEIVQDGHQVAMDHQEDGVIIMVDGVMVTLVGIIIRWWMGRRIIKWME